MANQKHTSDEEEAYFKREDDAKKAKIRRERQIQALRDDERASVADALESNEDAADAALSLGFDAETARVLPLVPLIQVAWADGKITKSEYEKVQAKARKFGVEPDSPADEFLSLLLEERPTRVFFVRVNQVIRQMVEENPGGDITSNVLSWSKAVAEASGGFFGLTNPIHKEEQKVLDDFAEIFGVEPYEEE